MKKLFLAAFALSALALVSCNKKQDSAKPSSEGSIKIAMVTDSGDITDQSFNQTTYAACKEYAGANGLSFNYYKPAGDSTADRVASINAAIQDEYNVLVLPGYLFAEAIVETAEMNSDVTFVGLDIGEFDLMSSAKAKGKADWKVPANVFCAVYAEEIPGFMAGYAAVKEGYKHLGFLGGMAVPAVIRFGYGFVQGADKAASELGISDKVAVEYVYADSSTETSRLRLSWTAGTRTAELRLCLPAAAESGLRLPTLRRMPAEKLSELTLTSPLLSTLTLTECA